MILKSSLFAGLALTIVALTLPLRLFDANVGACKDTANSTRIEACSKAIRLEPHRSINHHNRGLAYQTKGDLDHAIADYSEAISRWQLRKNASKGEYLSHRADAYKQQGNLTLAVADYDAAIRLVAHDSNLFFNRGQLFQTMSDYDRAIADYTHAIAEFDPAEHSATDKRNYLTARGEAYKAKGEAKLALADFDQVAAIDAGSKRVASGRRKVASVVKG